MSNLSELLPTGGGQNSVDFVATGTLASGQTVALKTDGTVEAVAETSFAQSVGTKNVMSTGYPRYQSAVYDSVNNKVVVAYGNPANSNYATAVVGTVSGSAISFGTPVVFNSAYGYIYGIGATAAGKILIGYRNPSNSNFGTLRVGTVSGTSISFGAVYAFIGATYSNGFIVNYSSTTNLVLFYSYVGGSGIYGAVATISGTSVSLGTGYLVASGDGQNASYDPVADKIVLAYSSGSGGSAVVATVSGTTISYGTPAVYDATQPSGYIACAYHSGIQKTAIAFTDGSAGSGTVVLGTVSGTSISFGSTSVFNAGDTYGTSLNYNPVADGLVFFFRDNANNGKIKVMSATVSGDTFSFSSELTVVNALGGAPGWNNYGIVYDPDTEQSILAYADPDSSYNGTLRMYTFPYTVTNNTSFIGITAEAISSAATGPVNVYGGINAVQTGLTIASDYYVQADGTLSTASASPAVKAGQAISATTINLKDLT